MNFLYYIVIFCISPSLVLYEARSVHMVQKEVKLISDEKVNFNGGRA